MRRRRRRSLAPTLISLVVGIGGLLALYFGQPGSGARQEEHSRPEAAQTPKAAAATEPTLPKPKPPPAPETPPPPPPPLLKPAAPARSIIPPGLETAVVTFVADGDTVTLADGRKIRYIGIDTPEREERFYDDAKKLNASLVLNQTVHIELDVTKQDTYKRTLAYLYVRTAAGEEKLVNAEMLKAGLARCYTFPPNVKHVDAFLACQREAIDAGRGSWKDYVFNSESYFVSTPNGKAFHRPSCRDLKDMRNLTRYADAREALNAGKSPCRNCKP